MIWMKKCDDLLLSMKNTIYQNIGPKNIKR
jgi:hypothetical protein